MGFIQESKVLSYICVILSQCVCKIILRVCMDSSYVRGILCECGRCCMLVVPDGRDYY